MKYVAELISGLIFIVSWMAGMVLANGFWSTAFAIFFPPWGWYLIVERTMLMAGIAT